MTSNPAGIVFPDFGTIKARMEDSVCYLQFDRPAARNAINAQLIAECSRALDICEEQATIVVLSGLPDYFCFGADFGEIARGTDPAYAAHDGPGPMYDLWLKLATGPFVSIALVRGKANAGGMGFVAACDLVLADDTAQFSLSELLFGVYPACVLPFLIRRVGLQKAHALTLSTQTIPARVAAEWGLVDAFEAQADLLLRRHVMRLKRLSKVALKRYKAYISGFGPVLAEHRDAAIAGNLEVFTDPGNVRAIKRYVEEGLFPWEQ